jgi:hypothetical protein
LNVAHHLEGEFGGKNAGILPLVLFQDVCLHRATHMLQGKSAHGLRLFHRGRTVFPRTELVQLLVNRCIQKHRQNHRRRAVDGH